MSVPLACDLSVFTPQERQAHEALSEWVFSHPISRQALDDGYGFEFTSDEETAAKLATFIVGEHRCCPFFDLALRLKPESTSLWLMITGGVEIKAFIEAEIPV